MPFDVSEEQSLLTSMLTERDTHIATLTHQLHATSEVLHATQAELQAKAAGRKAQREEHSAAIKHLKEEHADRRRVLATFERHVRQGGGRGLHEYAALMRSANDRQVESSYVIRLQAQLCRAMHSLGVMESQLALVKENCSSLIRCMKEDLSHMVDDRTRREIELMNGLAKVDQEKRVMAAAMQAQMTEKEELLDQVREEYEELGLEYDETAVKRALEVKYLAEQTEKVLEDKGRLERELLAALVEREAQIQRATVETGALGAKLEGLRQEAEERERNYRTAPQKSPGGIGLEERREAVAGNQQAANISVVAFPLEDTTTNERPATGEESKPGSDDGHTDNEALECDSTESEIEATSQEAQDGGVGKEEGGEVATGNQQDAIISGVASQLESATVNDMPTTGKESKPESEDRHTNNGALECDHTDNTIEATSQKAQEGGDGKEDAEETEPEPVASLTLAEEVEVEARATEATESTPAAEQTAGAPQQKDEEGEAKEDAASESTPVVETAATKNETESQEANENELNGGENDACTEEAAPQLELPLEEVNEEMETTDDTATTADETEASETPKDDALTDTPTPTSADTGANGVVESELSKEGTTGEVL